MRHTYSMVSDGILRGARPTAAGVKTLAELGVKTILNLNTFDDNEALNACLDHGVTLFNVDLPGIWLPREKDWELVDRIIADPKNWPLYVHCRHGRDRTGLAVARQRIREGWTATQATYEMQARGCRWPFSWLFARNLRKYATSWRFRSWRKRVGEASGI